MSFYYRDLFIVFSHNTVYRNLNVTKVYVYFLLILLLQRLLKILYNISDILLIEIKV